MDAIDKKANPEQQQVFASEDQLLLLPEHND